MGRKSNEKKAQEAREAEEKLAERGKTLFERAVKAVSENRPHQIDDMRFRAADPDNQWQWPDKVLKSRQADPNGARPCLTINKLPQHVSQVTNQQRQNRPQIKYIPVDDKADKKVADLLNGVVRHIQYSSNADVAYDTSCDQQVTQGEGYIRVLTDYCSEDSFDQDIVIERVINPLSVYMILKTQPDGSDSETCFINDLISKDEFKRDYPGKEPLSWDSIAMGDSVSWVDGDKVRICEWWQVEYDDDTLCLWHDGTKCFESDDEYEELLAKWQAPVKTRKVQRKKVVFRKLFGGGILDEQDWPGTMIPVARVVGNEYHIEGKTYVSGIVRNAKDAQRMYNYWSSLETETIALAPKAPFVGAAGQFEGYEDKWKTANTINYAYLEYNPVTDEAGEALLPAPQRQMPPMPNGAIIQAKMGASDDIKATTAQYDASLGQQGNETSGRAIIARRAQGDTATYHYIDNLSRAIRYVGKIILDLFPRIYDTRRVARILGEDDAVSMVVIDPNAELAYQELQDGKIVINPTVGKYDVMVTTGPSYATKRQEFADFANEFTRSNPELMKVMGDLMFKALDVPYADKISERMEKLLPPELKESEEQEIPQEVKQAIQNYEQMIQQMEQALQNAMAELDSKDKDYQFKLTEQANKFAHEIELAILNNDTKKDVEEIKGWIEMIKNQQVPPPILSAHAVESMNEDEPTEQRILQGAE